MNPRLLKKRNQGVRWKIVFPREFWTAVHKGEGMQRQVQRDCLRTQLWTQWQSLNNSPSNSTNHIPSWKAASSSANQEIWQVLQIPKFQNRNHKSRYMNAVHNTPSYSFKINFRIILPGTRKPSKCYTSISPSFPHISLPPHPPWPVHPENHKSRRPSWYTFPLTIKYCPQHPNVRQPQPIFP